MRKAVYLLGRGQARRWIALVILAAMVSGFEMVGAFLVYVLLSLVADPSGDVEVPLLGDLRAVADGIDEETFMLALLGGIAVFFVLQAVVEVVTTYAQARVANHAGARLSTELVSGYLSAPYSIHLRRNSSELIRNCYQAPHELVNQIFFPMIRIVAQALITIGLLFVMVSVAPLALLLAALAIGLASAVLLLVVQPRLKRLGREAHWLQRDTLSLLQSALHGVRDVKIFGKERWFVDEYARKRRDLAHAHYMRTTLARIPHSTIELVLVGFILVFFALTVSSGDQAGGALSTLGLFAYVSFRIKPGVQQIIKGLNDLRFSTAPIEDLESDLRELRAIQNRGVVTSPIRLSNEIELKDVSFLYAGEARKALSNIQLRIRRGEEIGICGPTGGGKTTLTDVITGLLEPRSGTVKVDGVDIQQNLAGWQLNLGVVPQTPFLLDDTLRMNVAFGMSRDDVDEEAVEEAVGLAQLGEFVQQLPHGLDTVIGERGIRVSGGQRQRIAIARALYRRPDVLVFDEGTSALDNTTEAALMCAIEKLRGEHTILLVAHRLSTVRQCDRVVFVEDGVVSGIGSYTDLLAHHPRFRSMAEIA